MSSPVEGGGEVSPPASRERRQCYVGSVDVIWGCRCNAGNKRECDIESCVFREMSEVKHERMVGIEAGLRSRSWSRSVSTVLPGVGVEFGVTKTLPTSTPESELTLHLNVMHGTCLLDDTALDI